MRATALVTRCGADILKPKSFDSPPLLELERKTPEINCMKQSDKRKQPNAKLVLESEFAAVAPRMKEKAIKQAL